MAGRVREAVHQEPIWRDRSNFIIAASIRDGGDVETEQLWARRDDEGHFEICCIPFFVYDLALGDVVETSADYLVQRVIRQSGRYVFRVWFGESFHPRDEVAGQLKGLGSLVEWSSPNLLAVDAVDLEHAQMVADFLVQHQDAGHLAYETGRS